MENFNLFLRLNAYSRVFDPHFEAKIEGETMLGNQLNMVQSDWAEWALLPFVDSLGSLFLFGLFRQV